MPWNQIHRSWDAVESEITVKTKDRKKIPNTWIERRTTYKSFNLKQALDFRNYQKIVYSTKTFCLQRRKISNYLFKKCPTILCSIQSQSNGTFSPYAAFDFVLLKITTCDERCIESGPKHSSQPKTLIKTFNQKVSLKKNLINYFRCIFCKGNFSHIVCLLNMSNE